MCVQQVKEPVILPYVCMSHLYKHLRDGARCSRRPTGVDLVNLCKPSRVLSLCVTDYQTLRGRASMDDFTLL